MQLPCSLKTYFSLPQEVFECIVPVALKVFSSLDFMFFYMNLFYLRLRVDFFFFMVVFVASEVFCNLWVTIF